MPCIKKVDIPGDFGPKGTIKQLSSNVFAMKLSPDNGQTIPVGFRPKTEIHNKHERNFYSNDEWDVKIFPDGKVTREGYVHGKLYAVYPG